MTVVGGPGGGEAFSLEEPFGLDLGYTRLIRPDGF